MIYPASYDITLLQNSTYKVALRVTQKRKTVSQIVIASGKPKFVAECHKLEASGRVVFAPSGASKLPCDVDANVVYFVMSSGLTDDEFYVSSTATGVSISADDPGSGTFYVATPVNLSGYTIDADLAQQIEGTQVATFSCTATDATNGLFEMVMAAATTSGLDAGRYGYDVSLTTASGERYYWVSGVATVQRTFSRN
jgi:hypothetical protein